MGALEAWSGAVTWARVRASRVLSRIGKALFAFGIVATYIAPGLGHDKLHIVLAPAVGAAFFFAFLGFVLSFVLWFSRRASTGSIAVDSTTIRVTYGSKSRIVARADVASAYVVQRPFMGGFVPTLEIVLANGDVVTARMTSQEQAAAFVDALGFGAGGRRVTVAMDAPARRLFHVLIAFGAYYLGAFVAIPFMFLGMLAGELVGTSIYGAIVGPATLAMYALLRKLLVPPTMTIGDDGIAYAAGRKRLFVPRASLVSIEQQHPGMPLVIRSTTDAFVVNGTVLDVARRSAAAQVAYQRLVAAPKGHEPPAAFQREGRTIGAWREHLRALFDAGSYRTAGASVDDAAAVLKSPLATPEQRVGAALALRVAGQPAEQIRIAAAGAADERVRVALETVADADDDAPIEKALRRLA